MEEELRPQPFGREAAAPHVAPETGGAEQAALARQVVELKQELASLRLLRDIAKAPAQPSPEDERERRQLGERVEALSRERDLLKARLASIEEEMASERGTARSFQDEKRQLSAQAAQLSAELARANEDRAAGRELARKVEELSRARQTLEANCDGLLSERTQMAKQLEALQAEMRQVSTERAREAESSRAQIDKLASQNEIFMASLRDKEAVDERCRVLARDLEAAQRQIRDLTVHRDREEAVQKRLKLQSEIAEKESCLRELVRRQETLEGEVMEREKLMKEILREQEEIEKEVVRAKQAQKYLSEQTKWRDRVRAGSKRPSGVQIQAPGEGAANEEERGPEA